MSTQPIREIYDTLFDIESNSKKTAYPIHKRLDFGQNNPFNDIYEWLFQHLDIPRKGQILDAGCGVGFGSFFLSENTDCTITGISLSPKEVALANSISKERGLEECVKFQVKSFDTPIHEKFDCIIAVESVKHSLDLNAALKNLTNALKTGGKLIIVEDLYQGKKSNAYAKKMAEDWSLIQVYSKSDYLDFDAKQFQTTTKDLTSHTVTVKKNSFLLKLRYLALSAIVPFLGLFKKGNFLKIMRGGLALDILYNRGEMTYEVLIIQKTK